MKGAKSDDKFTFDDNKSLKVMTLSLSLSLLPLNLMAAFMALTNSVYLVLISFPEASRQPFQTASSSS